jgi:hypothetical protein
MATHYARLTQKGVPACGEDVVDSRVQRTSKWNSGVTRPIGKQSVSVQHITSQTRTDVDCAACEPFMDADGIP